MYKGIDVSSNQGVIDWKKVKAAGCDFAILRSTVKSGTADKQFAANVAGCITWDIPFEVYKYTYAVTPTQAVEEAKRVIALLIAHGIKTGRIWWDVEDPSLRALSRGVLTGIIQSAADTIIGAGYQFGIYTGKSFYEEGVFDTDAFTCPMWIARYPNSGYYALADNPPADIYKPAPSQPLLDGSTPARAEWTVSAVLLTSMSAISLSGRPRSQNTISRTSGTGQALLGRWKASERTDPTSTGSR